MFEYKVVEAKNAKDAETQMNKYARDGWKVISNTYWMNLKPNLLLRLKEKRNDERFKRVSFLDR